LDQVACGSTSGSASSTLQFNDASEWTVGDVTQQGVVSNSNWWLRSAGGNNNSPAYVGTNGQVVANNTDNNYAANMGIRPAMLVNIGPDENDINRNDKYVAQPASISGSNLEIGMCGTPNNTDFTAVTNWDEVMDPDGDSEPSCLKYGNYLFDVTGMNKRGDTAFGMDSGVTNMCAAGANSYDDDMNGNLDDGECPTNSVSIMLSDKTSQEYLDGTGTSGSGAYVSPFSWCAETGCNEYSLDYSSGTSITSGSNNTLQQLNGMESSFWSTVSGLSLSDENLVGSSGSTLADYAIGRNLSVNNNYGFDNYQDTTTAIWNGKNCTSTQDSSGCLGYTLSSADKAIQNQYVTIPSMVEALCNSSKWSLGDTWTRSPSASVDSSGAGIQKMAYVGSNQTGTSTISNNTYSLGATADKKKYFRPLMFLRLSLTTFSHDRKLMAVADNEVEAYDGKVTDSTQTKDLNVLNKECYGSNVDALGNPTNNGLTAAHPCKFAIQVPKDKAGISYQDLNFGEQIGAWGAIYSDSSFAHQIDSANLPRLNWTDVYIKTTSEDGSSYFYDVKVMRMGDDQPTLYIDDGTPEVGAQFRVRVGGGEGSGAYSVTSETPDICSVDSTLIPLSGVDRLGTVYDDNEDAWSEDIYSEAAIVTALGSGQCKLDADKDLDVSLGLNPAATLTNYYKTIDVHFQGQTSETYPEPTDLGPEGDDYYLLSGGEMIMPEQPTWDDHVFLGWCPGDDDTCSGDSILQVGDSSGVITASGLYTAKWRLRGHDALILAINTGQEIDGIDYGAKTAIEQDYEHPGDSWLSGEAYENTVTFSNDKEDLIAEDLQISDYASACFMSGGTEAHPISPASGTSDSNCQSHDIDSLSIPITTSFGDPNIVYVKVTSEANAFGEARYYKLTIYRIGKEQTTPVEFGPEILGKVDGSDDQSGAFRIQGVSGGNGFDANDGKILVKSTTPTICSVGSITGNSEDGFVDSGAEYAADGKAEVLVNLLGIGVCSITAKRLGYQDITNVNDTSLNQSYEASDYFADNTAKESFNVYALAVELNGGLYTNGSTTSTTFNKYVLEGGTATMPEVGSVAKTGYDLMAYCYGQDDSCNPNAISNDSNNYLLDTHSTIGPITGAIGSQTYTIRWGANGRTLVTLADQDINPEEVDYTANPTCTSSPSNEGSQECPIIAKVTVPNDKISINTISQGGDMGWGTQISTTGKICKLAWSIANCGDLAPATNFYSETDSIPLEVRTDAVLPIQTTSASGSHWYYIVTVDRLGKQQTTPISWGEETVASATTFNVSRIYGGDGTGNYQVYSATSHVCKLTDADSSGKLNVAPNTAISVTMLQQGTCRLMGLRLEDDTYDAMTVAQPSPDFVIVQVNFDASPGVMYKGQSDTTISVLVALVGGSGVAPDVTPYRAGYSFMGWCYPSVTNCTYQVRPGQQTGIITDALTTYHAKWTQGDAGSNSNAQLESVAGVNVQPTNMTAEGAGKLANVPLLADISVPNNVSELTDLTCGYGNPAYVHDLQAELTCGDFVVGSYSIGATSYLMSDDFSEKLASSSKPVSLGSAGDTTTIYVQVLAGDQLSYNYYKINVYREKLAQAPLTLGLNPVELDLTTTADQDVEGRIDAVVGGGSDTGGAYALTVTTPNICDITDDSSYTITHNDPIASGMQGTTVATLKDTSVGSKTIHLLTYAEGRCSVSLTKTGGNGYESVNYVNPNPNLADGLNGSSLLTTQVYSVLLDFGNGNSYQEYIGNGGKQKLPGTGTGVDLAPVRNGYDPANSGTAWCDQTKGSNLTCKTSDSAPKTAQAPGYELTISENTSWLYTWQLHQSGDVALGNKYQLGGLVFDMVGFNDGTGGYGTCQSVDGTANLNCPSNIGMLILDNDSASNFTALSSTKDASDQVLNTKYGDSTTYDNSTLKSILDSKLASWEMNSFINDREIVPRQLTDVDLSPEGKNMASQVWWSISGKEANLMSSNETLQPLLSYSASSWWARDPGSTSGTINFINGQNVDLSGQAANSSAVGARPALFVNLDSLLLEPNKTPKDTHNILYAVNDGVQDLAISTSTGDGSQNSPFVAKPITVDSNKTTIRWQDLVLNNNSVTSRATAYLYSGCSSSWTSCTESPATTVNGSIYVQVQVVSESGVTAYYNLTINKAGNPQPTPIVLGETSNESTTGLLNYNQDGSLGDDSAQDQFYFIGVSGGDSTGNYNIKIDPSSTDYCLLVDDSGTPIDNSKGMTILPDVAASTYIHVRLKDSNLDSTSCKVLASRGSDVNYAQRTDPTTETIYRLSTSASGGNWVINDVKQTSVNRYAIEGGLTYMPSQPTPADGTAYAGYCPVGGTCNADGSGKDQDGEPELTYSKPGGPSELLTKPERFVTIWSDDGAPNQIPAVDVAVNSSTGKVTLTVTKTTDAITARDKIKYKLGWSYKTIVDCKSTLDSGAWLMNWTLPAAGPTFTVSYQPDFNTSDTTNFIVCAEDDATPPNAQTGITDGGYSDSVVVNSLTYDMNGGNILGNSSAIKKYVRSSQYGISDIVSEDVPTKADWTFGGWSDSADSGDNSVLEQVSQTNCPGNTYEPGKGSVSITGDTTLYACWLDTTKPTLSGTLSNSTAIENGALVISNQDNPTLDITASAQAQDTIDSPNFADSMLYSFSCGNDENGEPIWSPYAASSGTVENQCGFTTGTPFTVSLRAMDLAGNLADTILSKEFVVYSVTFDPNTGTYANKPDDYKPTYYVLPGATIDTAPEPSKTRYWIKSWCQDSDKCQGTQLNPSDWQIPASLGGDPSLPTTVSNIQSNMTFVAKWINKDYLMEISYIQSQTYGNLNCISGTTGCALTSEDKEGIGESASEPFTADMTIPNNINQVVNSDIVMTLPENGATATLCETSMFCEDNQPETKIATEGRLYSATVNPKYAGQTIDPSNQPIDYYVIDFTNVDPAGATLFIRTTSPDGTDHMYYQITVSKSATNQNALKWGSTSSIYQSDGNSTGSFKIGFSGGSESTETFKNNAQPLKANPNYNASDPSSAKYVDNMVSNHVNAYYIQTSTVASENTSGCAVGSVDNNSASKNQGSSKITYKKAGTCTIILGRYPSLTYNRATEIKKTFTIHTVTITGNTHVNDSGDTDYGYWAGAKKELVYYVADGGTVGMPSASPSWSNPNDSATFHGYCKASSATAAVNTDMTCDSPYMGGTSFAPVRSDMKFFANWAVKHIDISSITCSNLVPSLALNVVNNQTVVKRTSIKNWTPKVSPSNASDQKMSFSVSARAGSKFLQIISNATTNQYQSANLNPLRTGLIAMTVTPTDAKSKKKVCNISVGLTKTSTKTYKVFKDIPSKMGKTFGANITFLLGYGITTGTTATTYSPSAGVRRDQMAAFMYRLAGLPTINMTAANNKLFKKMKDIPSNPTFSTAIKWLVNEGITTGTDKKGQYYSPANTVNRAQMAMFLWRLAGQPTISSSVVKKWNKKLIDLKVPAVGTSHAKGGFNYAICWLAETGITTGVTKDTYQPTSPVQRVQMAAFLNRFYANYLMKTPI
jgi:hypothetical protein